MEILLFILIPIFAGGLGATIANNKGRSGVLWFFFCFLFPPLILFILVAGKVEKEEPAPPQVVIDSATPAPATSPTQATASPNPETSTTNMPEIDDPRISLPTEIACPVCAETIKGEAKICRFCNSSLADWRAEFIKRAKDMLALIEPSHENLLAGQMLATGNYYLQEGDEDKAKAYFTLLIQNFPGTEEALIAQNKI